MSTSAALFSRLRVAAVSGIAGLAVIAAAPALAGPAAASPPPSPTASPTMNASAADADPLPKILAWTWAVVDADTGEVLAGRDWHWPLPPASTLKALTAYTLLPRLQLDSTYIGTPQDDAAEGSNVGITAGSSYTVRDLLHGLLMPSGNDAASALAGAFGGMQRTTDAMNAEAARLGARNTHAVNTSGLDEPGQTSSAFDLATIMRASLNNPELMRIYGLHDVMFPGPEVPNSAKPRASNKIWTENRPILNYYPGALGGKTGFTSQAGRTYVGAFERNGRRLIVTMMRSAKSTEYQTEKLVDWGFANIDKVAPVDQLPEPGPVTQAPEPQPAMIAPPAPADQKRSGSSSAIGDPAGGGSPISGLALLFWLAVLAGAGLVVLRIRAIRKINQQRAAARAAVAAQAQAARDMDLRQPAEAADRSS